MTSVLIRALRGSAFAGAVGVAAISLGQPFALGGIHLYQRALSPLVARAGVRCRFTPTCSRYAEVAITRDGAARGGWKAIKRVARCGPWTAAGTRDEP